MFLTTIAFSAVSGGTIEIFCHFVLSFGES
jgi:hypothetical protein